jgi:hypothetical protein
MRLEPYPINYTITQSLWNKPTSTDNPLAAAIQKVCYVVGAVFTAMYETLRNLGFLLANQFIAQALKHIRVIVCLAEKLGDNAPESLRKLAGCISGKLQIKGNIEISAKDIETIMNRLKEKNLTMADIERMSAIRT